MICAQCGQESPAGFRFCGACGAALAESAPARELRKTVTVLFCDVSGSTALGERTDPEALRHVLRRYFEEIRAAVERHGGTVEKFIGDAAMAVFGIPQVREDDALRAVRAADEIRRRLPGLAEELGVALTFRTGVNTGEVVVGEGQTLATGDAVNVAARLEQAAEPGEILLGAGTHRLVRDAVEVEELEPLQLKGKSAPVEAVRLLRVDPSAPGVARRLDAPLVGRARELALLRNAFERAVVEGSCFLVTILGAAGIGKSRLVAEFLAGVGGEARIVRGRCLHYGEGITFWPLVEVVKQLGAEVPLDDGAAPAELFWQVRKLLEREAAERPLVVVFDDLHWAEPMFLDLLDHVADLSREAPILLLCVARPELLDERPGWAGGKLNATTTLLEALAPAESAQLLDALGDGIEQAARARIVEASEGNPLFVEEMAALVREQGDVSVPSTIQALLAARLDRLAPDERLVIERGAVEGKVFHRGAIEELAPEPMRSEVETHLASLVRKELIRPDRGAVADDAFRFRHLLIRDAAYDALPKAVRAELHERFAAWLDAHGTELLERDEIVGYHLEQAAGCRRELGEETATELAARAGARLAAAALRARHRGDLHAERNLAERALALLPAGEARGLVESALATNLTIAGEFAAAETLIAAAETSPSERVRARAAVARSELDLMTDPDRLDEDGSLATIATLERLGDADALVQAWRVVGLCRWMRAEAEATRAAIAEARRHTTATATIPAGDLTLWEAAVVGFGPFTAADMARVAEEIERMPPTPQARGTVALLRGMIAAYAGRYAEATASIEQGIELFRESGLPVEAIAGDQLRAQVAMRSRSVADHEASLRRGIAELEQLGNRNYGPTNMLMLGELLLVEERFAEAAELAEQGAAASAAVDTLNFSQSARIRADALLGLDGDLTEAEALARRAVELADRSDFPLYRAQPRLTLARVLLARGRPAEAVAPAEEALRLAQLKGDVWSIERAQSVLADLAAATA